MAKLFTARQLAYITARASGLGRERAALEAGYMASSAKVSASRMEKAPAIREAIEAAKVATANTAATQSAPEYPDPESYLLAVVTGATPPDPIRVAAARALLPFLKARQRAPVKAATPKQQGRKDTLTDEQIQRDDWAAKSAAVRARMNKP